MASLKKPLPEKWRLNELLVPAEGYRYFEHWRQHPFQPQSRGHSAVNAWWLAELAMLADDEQPAVENALSNVEPFTLDGQLRLEWIDDGSTQGFMLEAGAFVLLAVRGTEFYRPSDVGKSPLKIMRVARDLKVDARLILAPPEDQEDGDFKVEKGFYNEFKRIRTQLENFLFAPGKPVWLTGHSLGGAITTLAAFQYGLDKISGLYTFGSPCVGDQDFADAFDRKGLNRVSFRYVNGNDLVAKGLPFWRDRLGFPKYQHVGIVRTLPSSRNYLSRFIPLDIIDHAPIYYALKNWSVLVDGDRG